MYSIIYILPLLLAAVVNGYHRYETALYGRLPLMALEWDKPELFYDGDVDVYVLGMFKVGSGKEILKFNVSGDIDDYYCANYEVVGEFPSVVRRGAAAMAPNGDIYHFGGYTDDYILSTDIWKFNMYESGEPLLLNSQITMFRTGHRAVTVGDNIYLIGGDYDCGIYRPCEASTIEEFSISAQTSRIVATFPAPISHFTFPSVVTDGRLIYIFGGYQEIDYSGIKYDTIMTFDPVTYEITILEETLPEKVGASSAVFVDGKAYIFAGEFENLQDDDMFVFDTMSREVSLADVRFHTWNAHNSVYVNAQRKIFVFGGAVLPSDDYHSYSIIYSVDIPALPEIDFDCENKVDGHYAHPDDCRKFMVCSENQRFEATCPADLHFSPTSLTCVHPVNRTC